MSAKPPEGYTVPQIVTGLVGYAKLHGWQSLVQWTPPDYSGEPYVTVQVGRKAVESDYTGFKRGPWWIYKLTWHSRGCAPGKVKKFGTGLVATPDDPEWRDAPSVKQIRTVIHDHPAPGVVTVYKGPISRGEFNAIPNARVLRFSYDWMNLRYVEWIEDAPSWGWVLMNNYGNPDDHCVVSRADSRAMAAEHLTAFLAPGRAYGGDNLTVDEWEIAP